MVFKIYKRSYCFSGHTKWKLKLLQRDRLKKNIFKQIVSINQGNYSFSKNKEIRTMEKKIKSVKGNFQLLTKISFPKCQHKRKTVKISENGSYLCLGLLSLSWLLYSQCFDCCILWPSSGVFCMWVRIFFYWWWGCH